MKIGDKVRCIKSISAEHGGPRKGEVFKITSISRDGRTIGFELLRLKSIYTFGTIIGTSPNWGADHFQVIKNTWKVTFKYKINEVRAWS